MKLEDFARLEPFLDIIDLPRGRVFCEGGEVIRHACFPHDSIVSLGAGMEDGGLVDGRVRSRVGVDVSRESLGRSRVRLPGSASRIEAAPLKAAVAARPRRRDLRPLHVEARLAQTFSAVA
jgi:hypothetical protein